MLSSPGYIVRTRLFFFQAEDGIRVFHVTGVQTCALPIFTVLVVDDSAVMRQVTAAVLSRDPDLTVVPAADPIIAQEKMSRARPDVILLDLDMPRMDGLTFLRKIMREDPLPVVICSGVAGRGTPRAIEALEAGALDLVV